MSYLTAQIFHFLVAWLSLAFKGLPCLQACHLSQMHCGRPPLLHTTSLHSTPLHSTLLHSSGADVDAGADCSASSTSWCPFRVPVSAGVDATTIVDMWEMRTLNKKTVQKKGSELKGYHLEPNSSTPKATIVFGDFKSTPPNRQITPPPHHQPRGSSF